MSFEVKKVSIPKGEQIAYREAGSGNPVFILIHGNQSSSLFYEDLMDHLKEKAHIYALDMPGFGDSTWATAHPEMKDWGEDVKEFMDALDIDSAVVLGWSAGGGAAMELASSYPDRVKHLILLASVGVKGYPMFKYDESFKPILSQPVTTDEDILADPVLMKPVMGALERQDADFFYKVWRAGIFNLNQPPEETYRAYMQAILKERCFFEISKALILFNNTAEDGVVKGTGRINQIQCPVTWVHGRNDLVVPLATGLDSAKYFPGRMTVEIIPNAGHASFMDQPEMVESVFNRILDENR